MRQKLDKTWKRWTFWVSLTLILAFSFNTISIWALPYVITDEMSDDILEPSGVSVNQFTRRVIRGAVDEPVVEGVPTQGDVVVMTCPDHFIQFCRYDVSEKPLHIHLSVPVEIAPYWSISFYAHNTDNFLVINDLDAKSKGLTELNITLVRRGASYERQGDEMVYSPSDVGIILIRTIIPDRYSAEGQEVMRELLRLRAEARQ